MSSYYLLKKCVPNQEGEVLKVYTYSPENLTIAEKELDIQIGKELDNAKLKYKSDKFKCLINRKDSKCKGIEVTRTLKTKGDIELTYSTSFLDCKYCITELHDS